MAMTVQNTAVLVKAGKKNAPLRSALEMWLNIIQAASWNSLTDVRATFPTADGVSLKTGSAKVVVTVFNIKGNEYRLIAIVNYPVSTVLVCDVLTHAEYSKDHWKDRL